MAEGWARHLRSAEFEAHSAGIEKHGLNPLAVRAMAEAGVDISGHRSKTVDELPEGPFDLVVTVCGHAHENCPILPGAPRVVHAGFEDPPKLAADAATEEEALVHYRRVRDEIRGFVEGLRLETTEAQGRSADEVRRAVREGYAGVASRGSGCCSGSSCCGANAPTALAASLGYADGDLAGVPEGANMGLSCGNPTALAALCEGEVVLDLGAGGGFDVFVAGPRIGATGRAIGVDMTPEMVAKARGAIAAYRDRTGLDHVEFRLGEIEHLPVADASVDVVISNCVINLSPDKPQVWREIARVLRPGGRVAVSDVALLKPLPEAVGAMVEALVGCVAGAVLVSETEAMVGQAGLTEAVAEVRTDYVDAMETWADPLWRRIVAELPEGARLGDYVATLNLSARKPRAGGR